MATHVVVLYLSSKFALLPEQNRLLLGFVFVFFLFLFFFSVGAATSVWVCVSVCVFVFWLKVANWLVVAVRERERRALGSRRVGSFVLHPKAGKLWVFV